MEKATEHEMEIMIEFWGFNHGESTGKDNGRLPGNWS